MSKLTTRKYAKRREMTWEYAKGVDDINTARPSRSLPAIGFSGGHGVNADDRLTAPDSGLATGRLLFPFGNRLSYGLNGVNDPIPDE
jgi:hypothetical protein